MKTTLTVKGMTCNHCQMSVYSALMAVPGVQAVDVDLKSGQAVVTHDENKATPAQMRAAIEDVGFEAA